MVGSHGDIFRAAFGEVKVYSLRSDKGTGGKVHWHYIMSDAPPHANDMLVLRCIEVQGVRSLWKEVDEVSK